MMQRSVNKIAVTGGLASGKSTVCRLLQEQGATVLDADRIGHGLLDNQLIADQVVALLDGDILTAGKIDRKKIGEKVFHDLALLKKLEAILHPAIRAEIERQYQAWLKEGRGNLFVVEIALIFEAGFEAVFDGVLCVVADREIRRKRFLERNGPHANFEEREQRQLSQEEKARRATWQIQNNGDETALKKAVNAFLEKLKSA
jgi:dephospho-CoA kinase